MSTFRPGNYIWSLSYAFGVVVRDLGEWRPGFDSEFRYRSSSIVVWPREPVWEKNVVLTLIPRSSCSFFQKQVPNMDHLPNNEIRKEHVATSIHIYDCIYIYICKYIYLTWAPAWPPGCRPPTQSPVSGPCEVYVCEYVYAYYVYVNAYVYVFVWLFRGSGT